MEIRLAATDDAASLSRLVLDLTDSALVGGQGPVPTWLTDSLTVEAFAHRLASADYVQFASEVDGKVIGYIAIKGAHHLYHLFVDPQYQRRGIAHRLWQHLLANCPSDFYFVRSSLTAVPVYHRLGFQEIGPIRREHGIVVQPMEWHA